MGGSGRIASAGRKAKAARRAKAVPRHGGAKVEQRRAEDERERQSVVQEREAEERHVQFCQAPAEFGASEDPDHHTGEDDDHHQLQIMEGNRAIAVAERLERTNQVALRADEPAHDHVQQKDRHAQKQGRKQRRRQGDIAQFLRQKAVRQLILPVVRAQSAVRRQESVEFVDHVRRGAGVRQPHRYVVERPFHAVGDAQRPAPHPQHTVAMIVGKHRTGTQLLDVLRRQRRADDGQRLPATVDDDPQPGARFQPVGLGERLADDRLIGAVRRRQAPLPQVEAVQPGFAVVRDGNQPAGDRLREPGHFQMDVGDHAGLDLGDAGNGRDAFPQRFRRALQRREHVGEAVFLVVAGTGLA